MARLVVDADDLVLRLSWRERLLTRHREVRVPLADVRDVWIESDWWRGLRGGPRGGVCRPGHCVGERVHSRGTDFVAVRAGEPAIVVDLWPSAPYARLAVTAAEPDHELVRTVRERRGRERVRERIREDMQVG